MKLDRSSGILLHISCLPGKFGIGDIGPEAYKFIDMLVETKQKLWQILPLTPTDNRSPYSAVSAFAGNTLLISPELIVEQGFITKKDLSDVPDFADNRVDFSAVEDFKNNLFKLAYDNFQNKTSDKKSFEKFCLDHKFWLEDFALYRACKEYYQGQPWFQWDEEIKFRETKTINKLKKELADRINYHKFLQYLFYGQLNQLKEYADKSKIKIIGDMPFYMDYDSADIWVNPDLFQLDDKLSPIAVSGSPPDQFSPVAQRWGTPLYNWDNLKSEKYQWWIKRLKQTLELVHIVRIDHFRGLEAYWSIDADEEDAKKGKWVKAPGEDFLDHAHRVIGELNVIAEDLGHITEEVIELRNKFNMPGMTILQFAFTGDADNPYLPYKYEKNLVAYTATHDNDTNLSWFENLNKKEKDQVTKYFDLNGKDINWAMIRQVFSSITDIAIVQIQDILCLGSEARMNNPGSGGNNWTWRFESSKLTKKLKDQLKCVTEIYGR